MNELELQQGLVERMRKLFTGYTVMIKAMNPETGEIEDKACGIHIYSQYAPQPEGIRWSDDIRGLRGYDENDYEKNFPCIIVKLGERTLNQTPTFTGSMTAKILIGIYDAGEDCQNYREIYNIMNRIYDDLIDDRVVSKSCLLQLPLKSRLVEADTWPVYFGEIDMQFDMPLRRMTPEYIHGRRINDGRGIYEGRFNEPR